MDRLKIKNFSRHLEELIENSSEIFWIKNIDYTKQLYVSPAYEKIWGQPCQTLYEFPGDWINSIFPEDKNRLEHDMSLRNPKVSSGQQFSQSYRIVRPDRRIRWIEDESFAIFDSKGKHIGFAGIARDVTEKKMREFSLEKAITEANAANKAKTEFIENISHDIKTPLSGIIGMAELLKMQLQDANLKDYAEDIKKSGQQLLDLFNDVLNILSEDSNETLNETTFNLEALAREMIDFLNHSITQKNIQLNFDCSKNIGIFLGKKIHLNRIFLNLLSNAIKFTDVNGIISLKINILETTPSHKKIEIIVSDTGIGIPKESQNIIFDRYTRLSPSYEGKYKGNGLGLYIVKKMLDEMKGEIFVESEVGKGSTFRILISLKIASKARKAKKHSQPTVKLLQLMDNTEKINALLVEDNPLAQKVTEQLLLKEGCLVDIATTGKEALEKFQANDYNLVLMDIGLPDISGYEVTKQIKLYEKTENKPPVNIIGLTAHVQKKDLQVGISLGMNGFLSKPLTHKILTDTIKKIWRKKSKPPK